jgi:hypothetical protein
MPSAPVRIAAEVGFLLLVALGLALAQFAPVVIAVVMVAAVVLVALLEVTARATTAGREAPVPIAEEPEAVEHFEVPTPEPEPQPTPEPTVSERSARAILASAPPPLPPERPKQRKKLARRLVQRAQATPPPPPPEPVPVPARAPRAWNLWELQRAVRAAADDARHEEWAALLIHLREFANADGNLPLEFDALVRESFGPILEAEPEAEPAAAP